MDTTTAIFRQDCFRCDRPALTYDQQERPLCGRHATIFIAATRTEPTTQELWDNPTGTDRQS